MENYKTDELFDKITSEPKWYAGKFTRQYACKVNRLHKEGSMSIKNYETLFHKFGYEVLNTKTEWIESSKVRDIPTNSLELTYYKFE